MHVSEHLSMTSQFTWLYVLSKKNPVEMYGNN